MSDTPETDEELNYRAFGFYTKGGLPTDAVSVEFARNLERERDAFEKRLFDVRDILLDAMPDANAPTKILAKMKPADGMSLRDYFAGKALTGLVLANDYGNSSDADIAKGAYEYADAMLETRIKNQES